MDMIDRMILREGGDKLTQDPRDPGGVTRFGISQRFNPEVDVRNLDWAGAREVYTKKYINPHKLLTLPEWIQEAVFDFGVHSGSVESILRLQKLLGVKQDGKIGPNTLTAFEKVSKVDLYRAYERERINYLIRQVKANPVKIDFLAGWVNRVLGLPNRL